VEILLVEEELHGFVGSLVSGCGLAPRFTPVVVEVAHASALAASVVVYIVVEQLLAELLLLRMSVLMAVMVMMMVMVALVVPVVLVVEVEEAAGLLAGSGLLGVDRRVEVRLKETDGPLLLLIAARAFAISMAAGLPRSVAARLRDEAATTPASAAPRPLVRRYWGGRGGFLLLHTGGLPLALKQPRRGWIATPTQRITTARVDRGARAQRITATNKAGRPGQRYRDLGFPTPLHTPRSGDPRRHSVPPQHTHTAHIAQHRLFQR
jgi:hypothetical protein